jgi:hypothetical protein
MSTNERRSHGNLRRRFGLRVVRNDPNLLTLLSRTYLHLTVLSTVMQEASFCGAPTVVLGDGQESRAITTMIAAGAVVSAQAPVTITCLLETRALSSENCARVRRFGASVRRRFLGRQAEEANRAFSELIPGLRLCPQ